MNLIFSNFDPLRFFILSSMASQIDNNNTINHINGINNDNRIENLRFLCSNCDSQLPTYKNRRGSNGKS